MQGYWYIDHKERKVALYNAAGNLMWVLNGASISVLDPWLNLSVLQQIRSVRLHEEVMITPLLLRLLGA